MLVIDPKQFNMSVDLWFPMEGKSILLHTLSRKKVIKSSIEKCKYERKQLQY
jgi:hypothetical protein